MMMLDKISSTCINSSTLNRVLLFCLCIFLLSACAKEEGISSAEQLKLDEEKIKNYLTENNIQANRTASGLHYVIHKQTTGVQAQAGNRVFVTYTGKLLNGNVFDESGANPFNFVLGTGKVIKGWDEGIALLKKGESATFYIPSTLAYGSRATGSIPANSVLIFDVELVEVAR